MSMLTHTTHPDSAAGRTDHRRHLGPSGTRDYDLYLPAGWSGQPLPLVVMLHGSTQDPADFAAGTGMNDQADAHLFAVAYPAQSARANLSRSWHWYRAGDQRAGHGEPAIIAGITEDVIREFPIIADRVYVAGMSAGGAMAAVMAATYPDLYAAVGVHSGLAYRAARGLVSGLLAMHVGGASPSQITALPLIVFHGDDDSTVALANAGRLITARVGVAEPTGQLTQAAAEKPRRGHGHTTTIYTDADGAVTAEEWIVHGQGHSWSGGNPAGSYTDADGPSATEEMVRFFCEHRRIAPPPTTDP
jgi:poly(hydroxyalkanoate) depolymerase family esterase